MKKYFAIHIIDSSVYLEGPIEANSIEEAHSSSERNDAFTICFTKKEIETISQLVDDKYKFVKI